MNGSRAVENGGGGGAGGVYGGLDATGTEFGIGGRGGC